MTHDIPVAEMRHGDTLDRRELGQGFYEPFRPASGQVALPFNLELAAKIEISKKAMKTIDKIHRTMCIKDKDNKDKPGSTG